MYAELGQFSLSLAVALAVAGVVTAVCLRRRGEAMWQELVVSSVIGQGVFVALAFGALVICFVGDDFSVAYVANNSNSLLPWYYKVSAAWGGHEGSFLLWCLIMTLWMAAVVLCRQRYPVRLSASVLGILSLLNLGFLSFALFASSPFTRLIPMTPADGTDLNPLLQDFGLIVHPPLLYAGYVGLAVPFAFAIAALLDNRVDAAWARWARPWTNIAWAFLTLGIALGSWWAYYELGWGGWWFWDPVENASFMPWLAATALVHSLAVTEKRATFRSWTLLLAIFAFSLSLLGAFIVRSGVLTSVHAFAVDPLRGMFILLFLGLVVGGALGLYALRAGAQRSQVGFSLLSREFFMLINNGLLVLSLTVVLWGTLAPIVYEAVSGGRISIGPPFFNRFFVPFMLVLGVALALVPALNWKRTGFAAMSEALRLALPVALVCGLLLWFVSARMQATVALAVVVAAWVVITHALDLARRIRRRSLPLAYAGMTCAHLGFAVSVVGVAVTATQSIEEDVRMAPQESVALGEADVRFLGVSVVSGPNYQAQQGTFVITRGAEVITLRPEKRRYLAGGAIMTEAAIDAGLFADTYVSLGEPLNEGAWAVRLHYKPLVRWIWFGTLLMALGGALAVFDARYRRLRVSRGELARTSAEAVT